MIRCIGVCRFECIEFIEQNSEKRNDLVYSEFCTCRAVCQLAFHSTCNSCFSLSVPSWNCEKCSVS